MSAGPSGPGVQGIRMSMTFSGSCADWACTRPRTTPAPAAHTTSDSTTPARQVNTRPDMVTLLINWGEDDLIRSRCERINQPRHDPVGLEAGDGRAHTAVMATFSRSVAALLCAATLMAAAACSGSMFAPGTPVDTGEWG